MHFEEFNIIYELILSKISKMASIPTPCLDYAIIKFTSSVPGIIFVRNVATQCRQRLYTLIIPAPRGEGSGNFIGRPVPAPVPAPVSHHSGVMMGC